MLVKIYIFFFFFLFLLTVPIWDIQRSALADILSARGRSSYFHLVGGRDLVRVSVKLLVTAPPPTQRKEREADS